VIKLKTVKKVDLLDRQKIVKLLNEGSEINDILQKFKNYTKQQIAAIKAHITIGSYKMGVRVTNISESDKQIITKLGRGGLNSKQILDKEKFDYSPQQIAGVLAHI
jgi:hypothetical protein